MKYPNQLEFKPVNSSQIRAVAYDANTNELHVDFHKTGTYIYNDVPKETHDAMINSDSHGSFFHKNIKGKHTHRKP